MDVLKIAQNPLNLQTSEMVKACVRRQDHCPYQASGILKQKAPKYLRLLRGGDVHAASRYWALVVAVMQDFQEINSLDVQFSHPLP